MHPVDHFFLRPSVRNADGFSELWSSGTRASELVPGVHLEAQYAVGNAAEYLLFSSYDLPYEESLYILLVDERGELVEQAQLGAPYTPGLLKELRVVSPDCLHFDFQGPV